MPCMCTYSEEGLGVNIRRIAYSTLEKTDLITFNVDSLSIYSIRQFNRPCRQ